MPAESPAGPPAEPPSRRSGPDPREVLTRHARPPDATFAYGTHPEQVVDVHLPPSPPGGEAPAPVVVLLHGGFWRQAFDRVHTRPLAEALSAAGFVVLTPEYRRSGGDGGYPQTFEDVAAALDAVDAVESLAPGRGDLSDLTLVGHSAGGQLALWVAGRVAARPGASRVRRVVALAPVADLVEALQRDLGDGAVAALMGGSPTELPDAYADADALRNLADLPPTTVVHGSLDDRVPVDMSRRLRGVELVELADVEHFGLIDPRSAAWDVVLAAVRG